MLLAQWLSVFLLIWTEKKCFIYVSNISQLFFILQGIVFNGSKEVDNGMLKSFLILYRRDYKNVVKTNFVSENLKITRLIH